MKTQTKQETKNYVAPSLSVRLMVKRRIIIASDTQSEIGGTAHGFDEEEG